MIANMKKKNAVKTFDVNPKFVILSKKNTGHDRQVGANDGRRSGNSNSPLPEESLSTEDLIGALTESNTPKSAPVLSLFSSSHVQDYPSLGSANKVPQSRNPSSQNGFIDTYNGRHNSLTEDLSRQLTNSSPTSDSIKSGRALNPSSKGVGASSLHVFTSSGGKKYQPPAMKSSAAGSGGYSSSSDPNQNLIEDAMYRSGLSHPVQILARTSQAKASGSPSEDKGTPVATINSFLSGSSSNESSSTSGITVSNLLKLKLAGNTAPKIVSNDPVGPQTSGTPSAQYNSSSYPGSKQNSDGNSPSMYPSSSPQPVRPMAQPISPGTPEHSNSVSIPGRSSMNPNAPSWTPPQEVHMPQHGIPYPNDRWDAPPPDWSDEMHMEYSQLQNQMHWNGFNPHATPFVSKQRGDYAGPNMHQHHMQFQMQQYSGGPPFPFPDRMENQRPPPEQQESFGPSSSLPSSSQMMPSEPTSSFSDSADNKLPPSAGQNVGARRSKSLLPDTGFVRPMRPPSLPASDNAVQSCLYCGGEATLECSTCALIRKRLGVDVRAFFCSVAHQQLSWKQHHESVHQQYSIPQKKSTPVHAVNPSTPIAETSSTPIEPTRSLPLDCSTPLNGNAEQRGIAESADLPRSNSSAANAAGSSNTASSTMNYLLSSILGSAGGSGMGNRSEFEASNTAEEKHVPGEGADLEILGNSILNEGILDDGLNAASSGHQRSPLSQPASLSIAIDAL